MLILVFSSSEATSLNHAVVGRSFAFIAEHYSRHNIGKITEAVLCYSFFYPNGTRGIIRSNLDILWELMNSFICSVFVMYERSQKILISSINYTSNFFLVFILSNIKPS